MKRIIKISIFSLFSFFCMRSMDAPSERLLSDKEIQNIITSVNTSHINIVAIVKKNAQEQNTPLTAQNLRSLLQLNQEQTNDLFFNSITHKKSLFNTMLAMGADINTLNKNKENCLFYTSDVKTLKTLIAHGADVHCLNASGYTPLTHHCNFNTQPDLLTLFLEAGANPNEGEYQDYNNLLAQAVMRKCALSVKLLCKHKADVNPRLSPHLTTPLMLAITSIDDNKLRYYEIIETLLESGAIADCHDNLTDDTYYRYALHHATGWPNLCTYNEKIILLLLKHKANPNRAYPFTEGKNYPLHQAVKLKHLVVITALLQHGARTDYRNQEGLTPFGLAQSLHCPDNIITLLAEHTIITEDDNPADDKQITKKNMPGATAHDQSKSEKCSIQ